MVEMVPVWAEKAVPLTPATVQLLVVDGFPIVRLELSLPLVFPMFGPLMLSLLDTGEVVRVMAEAGFTISAIHAAARGAAFPFLCRRIETAL